MSIWPIEMIAYLGQNVIQNSICVMILHLIFVKYVVTWSKTKKWIIENLYFSERLSRNNPFQKIIFFCSDSSTEGDFFEQSRTRSPDEMRNCLQIGKVTIITQYYNLWFRWCCLYLRRRCWLHLNTGPCRWSLCDKC